MPKKTHAASTTNKHEIRPGQSLQLLQELHILTRDGKLNQDSRRKLKQIYHLYQFIEPILTQIIAARQALTIVDHGAGKSYLGFILYDLFLHQCQLPAVIYGVETRNELVERSQQLAQKLGFKRMHFVTAMVSDTIHSLAIPDPIDLVTALHACDIATDHAIDFALARNVNHIVLVPCCQAEVASQLKRKRNAADLNPMLRQLWHEPIHAREFGSHLTNVLRCLRLEAHGYSVTVTELVGWEHSLKNELIIAKKTRAANPKAAALLQQMLQEFGLEALQQRFLANLATINQV